MAQARDFLERKAMTVDYLYLHHSAALANRGQNSQMSSETLGDFMARILWIGSHESKKS